MFETLNLAKPQLDDQISLDVINENYTNIENYMNDRVPVLINSVLVTNGTLNLGLFDWQTDVYHKWIVTFDVPDGVTATSCFMGNSASLTNTSCAIEAYDLKNYYGELYSVSNTMILSPLSTIRLYSIYQLFSTCSLSGSIYFNLYGVRCF